MKQSETYVELPLLIGTGSVILQFQEHFAGTETVRDEISQILRFELERQLKKSRDGVEA